MSFTYGPNGLNSMDDVFSEAKGIPGKTKKSRARWGQAVAATIFYRAWASALDVPSEVFDAQPELGEEAQRNLERVVAFIGEQRRSALMGEALANAIGHNHGSTIKWLVKAGAPKSPAQAMAGQAMAGSPADKWSLEQMGKSQWSDGLAYLSWCALAVKNRAIESLRALEECGVGAQERSAVFHRAAEKIGSDKVALEAIKRAHPWVLLNTLSSAEAGNAEKAEEARVMALAWAPGSKRDERLCWRALEEASWESWSIAGLDALKKRGEPMGKAVAEKTLTHMVETLSYMDYNADEALKWIEAMGLWCERCGGPASDDALAGLARGIEEAAMGLEIGEVYAGLEGVNRLSKACGDGKAGWGKMDALRAKESMLGIVSALASLPAEMALKASPSAREALGRLDALIGPKAGLKKSGPKRV